MYLYRYGEIKMKFIQQLLSKRKRFRNIFLEPILTAGVNLTQKGSAVKYTLPLRQKSQAKPINLFFVNTKKSLFFPSPLRLYLPQSQLLKHFHLFQYKKQEIPKNSGLLDIGLSHTFPGKQPLMEHCRL